MKPRILPWLGAGLLALSAASATFSLPAFAQPAADEMRQALQLGGRVAAGEEAFAVCQGCHRVGALGREDGSYPRLAGQHASVLIKQITDIRAGRRQNLKMHPFAAENVLGVQDIADIAAYLQQLPVPPDQGRGSGQAAALAQGRSTYLQDCARCHGSGGEGDAARFMPRLAGQHYRYLLREMRMIRDGERRNANPEMVELIRNRSDDELAAVADAISRFGAAGN
ncbi:MAG: hypothetical protein RIR00_1387 [Pseudomonadota bacterium]